MSRSTLIRALLALAVLAVSSYVVLTASPRLGLDLRGGTQIVLETRDSPTVQANAESTHRAIEVLRRRVDALGVAEPALARSANSASSPSCRACSTPARPPRSSAERHS